MDIQWNEDERLLVISGVEFGADQGGDGPIEVRVGVLRRVAGNDLPEGVPVAAVRLVARSSREVYGDPDGVYFERTRDGGVAVVDSALVVDSDDEPDHERRVDQLERKVAEAKSTLDLAVALGRVLRYEFPDVYPGEIAYYSFRVPINDTARSVYEIIQSVPQLEDLLPLGTGSAVLHALRSLSVSREDGRNSLDGVRGLVGGLGHRSSDLRLEAEVAPGLRVDALLRPYDKLKPLAVFEAKPRVTDQALRQVEQYREAAGAAASVTVSPGLLVANTAKDTITIVPSEATLEQAEELLRLLGTNALTVTPLVLPDDAPCSGPLQNLRCELKRAEASTGAADKGRAYEDLACAALALVKGLRVKYRNLRTRTSEIDIVAEYLGEPRIPTLEDTGRFVVAECKNWSSPAGAKELRDFHGKMEASRVQLGLMFSREGITGSHERDASGVVRSVFQRDGSLIVVVTHEDLEAVASGEDLGSLIARRCDAVRFQM